MWEMKKILQLSFFGLERVQNFIPNLSESLKSIPTNDRSMLSFKNLL